MKKISLTILFALACALLPTGVYGYTSANTADQSSNQLEAVQTESGSSNKEKKNKTKNKKKADAKFSAGDNNNKYPTFAVISDIHFGNNMGEGPMVKVPRTLKSLTAKTKLDAIIVVGDLTEGGFPDQYDQLVQTFTDKSNFINPVDTLLFMLGNHDNYGDRGSNYPIKLRPFNNGNDYPLDQYTIIKGYPFITISVRSSGNNDDNNPASGESSFPKEVQERLARWLEQASNECPGKPIFVFTHVPPRNTCYSTWSGEGDGNTWPTWSMRTINPILNKYPQVVVFGGHSHYPIGDPRSIHQGVNPNSDKQNYYTGIGTGSVTYSEIHSPSVDGGNHPNFYDHITEGLIVNVKEDGNVEIRRYDTRLDEEIQPDNRWLLKAPFDGSMFEYADIRDNDDNILGKPVRTGLPAPVFAKDADIKLTRDGQAVNITFPAATDNDVVFRYNVSVIDSKGNTIKNNWLFSGYYKNSETPASYSIRYDDLKAGDEYTIVIRAYDSYENASKRLTRTYTLTTDISGSI